MNPRAAYACIMIAAIAIGAILSRRSGKGLALSAREKWGIGIGGFIGAMLGAKLPYVLSDWEGLLSGAAWFSDGKTILCGLVGGYAGVELAKYALDVRIHTGDSFAVAVPAAIGIGRLACFQAGCCYGIETSLPWGVVFPLIDSAPRHPTQLYEAAFHITAALALWQLQRRRLLAGQLFKLYVLAYLAYRFVTEWIRPEAQVLVGLTAYQWGCIVLAGVFVMLWRRDVQPVNPKYEF